MSSQAAGLILWPMLAQIGLTFLLYAWLTVARMRAVAKGETETACFVLGRDEPLHVARITRNLSNQFELPIVFYALVITLIAFGKVTTADIVLAWIFVGGRVIHTLVQTQTNNVPLRGQVFMINFLAVVALAAHVTLLAFDISGH